jgi:2-polyprenyl-6-hydroxyphenyl methylase/3-demethylubiquinone-9 3-methyltransferase
MPEDASAVQQYYDDFWPKNVQHFAETKKYVWETVSGRSYQSALDAGCGPGICAIALSELAAGVVAVDISPKSVETAKKEATVLGRRNIDFVVGDLQHWDAPSDSFDLVWCWGVATDAADPMKVMATLFRVTRPGGELYLGVYLKTWLSPVHQFVRFCCRHFLNSPSRKRMVLDGFARLTRLLVAFRGKEINKRADNVSIQTQVDDWYYAPHKTFLRIGDVLELFRRNGFSAQCVQDRVGRFRSATIFVIRGVKNPPPENDPAISAVR